MFSSYFFLRSCTLVTSGIKRSCHHKKVAGWQQQLGGISLLGPSEVLIDSNNLREKFARGHVRTYVERICAEKTQSSSWHFLIFSLVFFIKCADGWGCWRACRASSYGHNFSYFQPEEKKSNLTNFHLQALCFFSGENSFMFSFRWEQ